MAVKKIFFRFEQDEYNTPELVSDYSNLYIEKCYPKSSCWWTNLKARIKDGNIVSKIMSNHLKALNNEPTEDVDLNASFYSAKTCPAIVNVLKNAYLVKAPCDMIITVSPDGDLIADIKNTSLVSLDSHPKSQFNESSNHFKDYINIKFKLPLLIKSDVDYCYLQPHYHNMYDMQVLSGVITKPFTNIEQLNVNVLVKTESKPKQFHIKSGDVLAYLMPFDKVNMEHSLKPFFKEHTSLNFVQDGRFKIWNKFNDSSK